MVNTVFRPTIINQRKPATAIKPPTYDFNLKTNYLTQSLNHIVYYDYDIPATVLQSDYNVILRELENLKNTDPTLYPTILNNVISTFQTSQNIYSDYIADQEAQGIVLPESTYSNLDALAKFTTALQTGEVPTNNDTCLENEELEMVLYKLYKNVGVELEGLLNMFSDGNLEELKKDLNYEAYSKLSVLLSKESYPDSFGYTMIYNALNSALEGLYKSTLLDISYKDQVAVLSAKLKFCENKEGGSLLAGNATMSVVGLIRPEIQEYINKYGMPPGAVFDPQKLAAIVKQLYPESSSCGSDDSHSVTSSESITSSEADSPGM